MIFEMQTLLRFDHIKAGKASINLSTDYATVSSKPWLAISWEGFWREAKCKGNRRQSWRTQAAYWKDRLSNPSPAVTNLAKLFWPSVLQRTLKESKWTGAWKMIDNVVPPATSCQRWLQVVVDGFEQVQQGRNFDEYSKVALMLQTRPQHLPSRNMSCSG